MSAQWSPSPILGGASWAGNPQVATKLQLLSTSAGLANTGDNNFNIAKVSTLFVCTITSLDEKTSLRIQNLSSIRISTFANYLQDSDNIQTTAKLNSFNFLNGTYALINRDSATGLYDPILNLTNLTTGSGSFQALTGAMTIAATTSTLNLYAGNDGINISGDARFLTGYLDMLNHNISSVSNLTVTNSAINSISSLRISTGTARVGTADIGTLTVGSVSLSGNLDMCNNNINNVATLTATTGNITTVNAGTVGATAGNFTTLSGTLTGNVNGNVNGNLTGNVTGNISNTNLTVRGQYSITETADVGSAISNYGSYGRVDIAGKGGLGGIVTITADVATPLNPAVTVSQLTAEAKGNYGLITPGSPVGYVPRGGLVSIIARQGLTPTPPAEVTSALFANGEIDLTAYSYGIVPGLIKLNSGANAMYAGAISPLTGIFGNNYIFGQYGNSILAALPPSGVPNIPGENYIYGLTGTVIDNGLYTDTIYNKFGGNLNLDSRTSNINITSSNSGGTLSLTSPTITLTGSSAINLTGNPTISGNLDMTDGNINNVAIISARPGSNMTIQNQESFLFFPTTALIYATGGTITESGGRTFHTFTTNGTFTLNYSVGTVEVALIGGGGGGGGENGGGGGAGNAIIATSSLATGSYAVTVGAGGAGGTASAIGGSGTQSRFANAGFTVDVIALGGGGGATTGVSGGANGGCGGGGAEGTESLGGSAVPGTITGMTGVFNSATAGGFNPDPTNTGTAGSGGGGTQSSGVNVSAITPSDGGDGGAATLYYGTYYGGGGGGSAAPTGVYGAPKKGRGGGTAPPTSGGNGSLGATTTQAEPGVANTGGGGGGGEDATGGYPGAAGGSGIVIVSYLTPPNERFTMGTSEEIFLSSVKVTVSNDLTVLGTTNIQATSVSTITVTDISTIGTAVFAGNVFMTGLSTVISRLFISDTNQIQTFVMVQGGTTNLGSYSINSPQNNVSYNGQQFPVSDWNCSASLAGFSIPQPYATNQAYVVATNVGGFWNIQSYMGLATLPGGGVGVQWTVRLVMTPRGIVGPNQLSAEAPSTISTSGLALNIPLTFMSSITASTITMEASRNISLLANIAPPAYISTGNITVAGTNAVDVLGNVVALGGVTDVDIEALTGDVNVTAASEIKLTAPNINITGNIGVAGKLDMNLHDIEDVKDLYMRRNIIFQSTSTYIADLGHIYGNTASPGGGLAIDYMYGMFFNSAGNDANIYATGGYFYVRNMARGVEVGAYNPAGTGDSAFYVANNELYLGTGTGHDVITNSGRNIAMNAGSPGGFISLYTSTIYTTSLTDTNITADRNITLRADKPGNSITQIASTITLQGSSAINLTGNVGISGNLDMTNGNINTVDFVSGVNRNALVFGSSFSRLTSESNLAVESVTGYVEVSATGGAGTVYLTGSNIEARGNLDMTNKNISNLSSIYFTQGAALTTNASNWTTGSLTTLNGDHVGGGKYIQWAYDNNPGTLINDNHSISLSAPVINAVGNLDMCNNNIKNVGTFSRMLSSTAIDQPILQFGEDNTGSGASGSVVINLATSYTSASSYVAFATMEDSDPAEMSVVRVSATSIEIYWQQGSGGSHVIAWNTMGI